MFPIDLAVIGLKEKMSMRSVFKWMGALVLSCATFVCSAEELGGNYVMYWMLDYSGKAGELSQKVADATDAGYINPERNTPTDFNWAKLVAVVEGTKTVVGGAPMTGLQAGGDDEFTALVAGLGETSTAVSSFWVEFYNYNQGTATLLGWSESITPAALEAQGAIADFKDGKYPGAEFAPWSPTSFTAVPEPTSGLLLLIGGALLALRRRRRTALNVEG